MQHIVSSLRDLAPQHDVVSARHEANIACRQRHIARVCRGPLFWRSVLIGLGLHAFRSRSKTTLRAQCSCRKATRMLIAVTVGKELKLGACTVPTSSQPGCLLRCNITRSSTSLCRIISAQDQNEFGIPQSHRETAC